MGCVIHKEHWNVVARLRQFDLTLEECLEVVAAAVGAASGCTANDIPSARGLQAYMAGTRAFRDAKLGQDGWDKSDDDNFSTLVNHRLKLRFAVANTNEMTGLGIENGVPRNKSGKGRNSRKAVVVNLLPMFPDLQPAPRDPKKFQEMAKKAEVSGYTTWYLCVYFSEEAARAELSLPCAIIGGFFSDWKERIILVDDAGPVRASGRTDQGSDIAINVRRRA